MSGDTVEIKDIPAFPTKIAAIRDAVTELRTATTALTRIVDTAKSEAASFTKGNVPAPVYGSLLAALEGWMGAIKPAADVVSDNAENAARTAASKFYAIVQTDQEAAAAIAALQSSGALGGPTGGGPPAAATFTASDMVIAQGLWSDTANRNGYIQMARGAETTAMSAGVKAAFLQLMTTST